MNQTHDAVDIVPIALFAVQLGARQMDLRSLQLPVVLAADG